MCVIYIYIYYIIYVCENSCSQSTADGKNRQSLDHFFSYGYWC